MAFISKKEDFVCDRCGTSVIGSGYTNHCPNCLWSKHVDVDPGDRKGECGGLMEPIAVENGGARHGFRVRHKCVKCGFERLAPVLPSDNFEEVLAVSRRNAKF